MREQTEMEDKEQRLELQEMVETNWLRNEKLVPYTIKTSVFGVCKVINISSLKLIFKSKSISRIH